MRRFWLSVVLLTSVAEVGCPARTRRLPDNLSPSARQQTVNVGGAVLAQSQHYKLSAATRSANGPQASASYRRQDGVARANHQH